MVGEQMYFSRKPPEGFGITFGQPIIVIINSNVQMCLHPIKVFGLTFVKGVLGTNVTIKVLCGIMRDSSLGDPYARYAAVARFMLETVSMKCLDSSFDAYVRDMTNTSWDGPAAGGGGCCLLLCLCTWCFSHISVVGQLVYVCKG